MDDIRVPGSGPLPPPSGVVLIGEAPGYNEVIKRVPFVGKSGEELNSHLERAGLPRHTVYVTNLCKTQPAIVRNKQTAPTKEMIERDEPELVEELAAARPRWIGAVGRFAARWLVGNVDMEYAHAMAYPLSARVRGLLRSENVVAGRVARTLDGSQEIRLYSREIHDTGWQVESRPVSEWNRHPDDAWIDACTVIPVFHPAAGLHNPEIQPLVWWDLRQLAAYVQGRLVPQTPVDLHPSPRYVEGVRGWPRHLTAVGVDTEGSARNPWSIQLSYTAGAASVVRYASMPQQRAAVRGILERAERVVYQNALHDQAVVETMELPFDWDKTEDIYVLADVLRLVPRGLKAGARRDCGMEMRSYTEVVGPAENRLAREYVEAAIQARVCYTCGGSGKVADEAKIAKRVDATLRTGKAPREYKTTPMVPCPEPLCVDGGIWPPRTPELQHDDATGLWKVSGGWEVQRYLRGLRKDIDAGKYDAAVSESDEADAEAEEGDSPRKRFRNWPVEVTTAISDALGADMPAPTLDDVPLAEAVDYAARDADATLRRYPILRQQVEELELWDAYRLDLDVMPVAAEIQKNGMRINRAYFAELVDELRERKDGVAEELESHIGRRINPASADQVAELMFGKMHTEYTDDDARDFEAALTFDLAPEKWTPTRRRGSVDEKTLEGIKLKYAGNDQLVRAVDLILEWRMCDKIGQFAEKLPTMTDATDRIHTRIKIGPATFRWASADPNLQQIPSRDKHGADLGRRVRRGFEVAEGRMFGNRDFDQIEVRVLAWYAQDETLLRIFRDGPTCPAANDPAHLYFYKPGQCRCHDPHFITAQRVFKIPLETVSKVQRDSAKNIKFGVVYGITPKGLKAQMDLRGVHWTVDECQGMIDLYLYEAYPGIGRFIMDSHAEARRYNMVRSLMGHIRYTPAVHSPIRSISEEALRQAANFKIQCTAAELMKMAERDLWRSCGQRFRELDALILMSEHDALAVEAPDDPDVIDEVDALMSVYMTNPYPLDGVEITSGSKWARTWGDTK